MSSPTPLPPITPVIADEPGAMSADPVTANVQALKALFPDAFSEGRVVFDTLRQLLGDAVDDGEEKYGLNWSGKRRARRLALTPSRGTLLPAPEDSVDWGETKNLMIEGDNLEVLKLLQKSYAGKIKLIYIDPPYNTGNDFVYSDDYQDSLRNYLAITRQIDDAGHKTTSSAEGTGRYHTNWLNMMYPRLALGKSLMRQDGLIAVSIDDHEVDRCKLVLEEIFGAENFIVTISWEKGRKNDSTFFSETVEYIHIFAKNRDELRKLGVWRERKPGIDRVLSHYSDLRNSGISDDSIHSEMKKFYAGLADTDPAKKMKHFARSDGRGLFFGDNISSASTSIPDYDIYHPITKQPCRKPARGWGCNPDEMERRISEDRVLFGVDETTIPLKKSYLEEVDSSVRTPIIYKDGRAASLEIKNLFGAMVFNNPKDREVLGDLFQYMGVRDGDTVLDFFAGSGTTGHAVMAQNAADGGDRRYIVVQLPEPLDPENKDQKAAANFCDSLGKPRTIAELTKERLRRAAVKVRADSPETTVDLGFRAYKLATSNLKAWAPGDNLEADLLSAADNLAPGRTEDDLLVELLLKRGIDLVEPSRTREIAGRTVHAFGGGVMLACLGDVKVADAEALADGMADWVEELSPVAPAMIFFKDAGFENDVAKTNVAKILDQRLNGRGPGEAHLLEAVRSV